MFHQYLDENCPEPVTHLKIEPDAVVSFRGAK
jgi:hypothetical protein